MHSVSAHPCRKAYTLRARRTPLYQPFILGQVQKQARVADRQNAGSLNQLPPRVTLIWW